MLAVGADGERSMGGGGRHMSPVVLLTATDSPTITLTTGQCAEQSTEPGLESGLTVASMKFTWVKTGFCLTYGIGIHGN